LGLAARPQSVPAGIYDLEITTAEMTYSGLGDVFLVFGGRILGGLHAGCRISDRLELTCADDEGLDGLSSLGDDGARSGSTLVVEGTDGLVDGEVELVGVAEGAVGQVVPLQVAP
jgi:hypothetical protein